MGPPPLLQGGGIGRIPAVRKGLSNQRMRIVQDLVTALLLGVGEVQFPERMTSRRGCHYAAGCYMNYEASLGFWEVYDRQGTEAALKDLGLDVRSSPRGEESNEGDLVLYAEYPVVASELAAQKGGDKRPFSSGGGAEKKKKSFYFYEPRYCCTIVLPDSLESASFVAKANAALVAAKKTTRDADAALDAFRQRLPSGALACALHWRLDDDFVESDHHLDAATYVEKMKAAVDARVQRCGQALLLLGDIDRSKLAFIKDKLATTTSPASSSSPSSARRGGGNTSTSTLATPATPPLALYTKQSLLQHKNWSREYGGFDDLVGAVDFEVGIRSDVFFGSPFSSFSVLVANARGDFVSPAAEAGKKQTYMPDVDVEDKLAGLFRLQFPANRDDVVRDPCRAFVALGPKYAKRLQRRPSCPVQQDDWSLHFMSDSRFSVLFLVGGLCSVLLVCANLLFFLFVGANGPLRHRARKPTTKH
mmetsp:Transcript_13768/g.44896  ORF Transcript_13768/g.44896 Transcript_13768/m.44896 type:complete len:476 (-) Transcript_13768:1391-2818(-)